MSHDLQEKSHITKGKQTAEMLQQQRRRRRTRPSEWRICALFPGLSPEAISRLAEGLVGTGPLRPPFPTDDQQAAAVNRSEGGRLKKMEMVSNLSDSR